MVVATMGTEIAGFLLLLCSVAEVMTIDLMAVRRAYRGRGIGRGMILFAERECPPYSRMRVGTQLANVASIRCYEAAGFRIAAASYVFHFHSRPIVLS